MSPHDLEPTTGSASSSGGASRGGSLPGRIGLALAWAGLAVLLLLLAGVLILQVPSVSRRVALLALARMYPAPRNQVALGAARGSWLGGVRLVGLRATRGDTLLVRADTVTLRYELAGLLAGRLHVRSLLLANATYVVQPPDTTAPQGPGLLDWISGRAWTSMPLGIDRLALERVQVVSVPQPGQPALELRDLTLRAHGVGLSRRGLAFALDTLGTRFPTPRRPGRWARLDAAGVLAQGRLDRLRLTLLSDASRVEARGGVMFGAAARRGAAPLSDAEFTLSARPLDLSDFEGFARGLEGRLEADVRLRGARADRWTGTARLRVERLRAGLEVGPATLDAVFAAGLASVRGAGTAAEAPFTLRGSGRLFDPVPTYDAIVTLERLPRLASPAWRRLLPRVDSSVRLTLHGAGVDRRRVTAVADATFEPVGAERERARVLGPGSLRARLARGTLDLSGGTGLLGGHAAFDATLTPGDTLRYDVRRLVLRHVDVARWSSDTLDSDVNATLAASGSGTDVRSLRAVARLEAGPSRYGRWRITSATARATVRNGRLGLAARAAAPGGTLALDALDAQLTGAHAFRFRDARVRGLDLARWSPGAAPSDLNGTLDLEGRRWDALAAPGGPAAGLGPGSPFVASGTLRLGPSWLRGRRLERGAFALGWRDGRGSARGSAVTTSGRLELDASARPFDAAPVVSGTARFHDLDLGALSDSSRLTTALNGTLRFSGQLPARVTARVRRVAPDRPADRPRDGAAPPRRDSPRRPAAVLRSDPPGDAPRHLAAADAPYRAPARFPGHPPGDAPRHLATADAPYRAAAYSPGDPPVDPRGGPVADPPGDPPRRPAPATATGAAPPRSTALPPVIARAASAPAWDFSLTLDRSRFGRLTLTGGHAEGRLAGGALRVEARIESPRGPTTLEARGTLDGERTDVTARGSVPLAVLLALGGRDTLDAVGATVFDVHVRGADPRTLRAEATVQGRGRVATARIDTLRADLRMAAGIVDVDSLHLRSNALRLDAGGRIPLFDRADTAQATFGGEGRFRDLAVLAPLLGVDTLHSTRGRVTVGVRGPADSLRVAVGARTSYLRYEAFELWNLEADAQAQLDTARKVRASRARAAMSGLRVSATHLRALTAAYEDTLGRRSVTLQVAANPRTTARLRARIAAADTGVTVVDLDTLDVIGDPGTWRLERPARIALEPDRTRFGDFALVSGPGAIRAHGVLARHGPEDLALDLTAVRLALFTVWLGREDMDGAVDGHLALTGTAAAPRARGELAVQFRPRRQPASDLHARLAWTGSRLDVDAGFGPRGGTPLTLTGSLPLALSLEPRRRPARAPVAAKAAASQATPPAVGVFEGPVDLRLRTTGFPLATIQPFLDDKQARGLRGQLVIDLHVTGRTHDLDGNGTFALTQGRVDLPSLGVKWRRMDVAGDLARDRLRLARATIHSGSGSITAQGEARLVSLTETQLGVKLHAVRFRAIATPQMRASVSGDVVIGGTNALPTMEGSIDVRRGSFTIERTAADTITLTRDDLAMLEETFGIRARATPMTLQQMIYDAARLALDVRIERGSWVHQTTRPELALEIAGQVRVTKEPHGLPQVDGRLQPVPGRGYVQELGRRFDFTGGEIRFTGDATRPYLRLETRYGAHSDPLVHSEVAVTLDIEGYPDNLELTLSSEPSMSNSEIVSYLATGQTSSLPQQTQNPSGGQQNLAAEAGVSFLTSRLQGLAGQKLGLDVVQIRQDGLRGATVVAGRYINPRLYVGFRQPVSYQDPNTAVTMNTRNTMFEIEYVLYRWLVLNLQGEASRVNSFFRSSYAY